jgi:hypothetical protein
LGKAVVGDHFEGHRSCCAVRQGHAGYADADNLAWNIVSGASGYVVDELVNGAWKPIAYLGSGSTSFAVTGLRAATSYTFDVAAYNTYGTTWAKPLSAITLEPVTTSSASAPVNSNPAPGSSGTVTLSATGLLDNDPTNWDESSDQQPAIYLKNDTGGAVSLTVYYQLTDGSSTQCQLNLGAGQTGQIVLKDYQQLQAFDGTNGVGQLYAIKVHLSGVTANTPWLYAAGYTPQQYNDISSDYTGASYTFNVTQASLQNQAISCLI